MVKEQRGRISELSRGRQEIVGDYKVCVGSLRPKGERNYSAWPSGFEIWSPPPYRYLDLFSVVQSSSLRPQCVNSKLVSLPPVGILN